MTSSELPPPPAPPPPDGPWVAGPPPTRPPVPIDAPSRTSPLTIALEAVGLVFFGVTLAVNALLGQAIDIPGIVIGFVFTLQRTLGWWFRTYTVTDTAVILDEGILQKHHRVVPFSRIQQVELRQQLTSRLFGIVTVHIETAGDAGATAISLRSLDLHAAEALRDHLLAEQRRVRAGLPAGAARHRRAVDRGLPGTDRARRSSALSHGQLLARRGHEQRRGDDRRPRRGAGRGPRRPQRGRRRRRAARSSRWRSGSPCSSPASAPSARC